MRRDCTAWFATSDDRAECGVIGPHTNHVGFTDEEGHTISWTDADPGAQRA